MNEQLVQNFNSVVRPEDTLIIDGDCLMGKIEDSFKWFDRLNGRLCLVAGNHDEKALRREWFRHRFEWIKDEHEMPITIPSGRKITLKIRHYPLKHDEDGKVIEKLPEDTFLIHGHRHSRPEQHDLAKPQLDVGVDGVAQYFPIPLEKVLELIQQHYDWIALDHKTRP